MLLDSRHKIRGPASSAQHLLALEAVHLLRIDTDRLPRAVPDTPECL